MWCCVVLFIGSKYGSFNVQFSHNNNASRLYQPDSVGMPDSLNRVGIPAFLFSGGGTTQ